MSQSVKMDNIWKWCRCCLSAAVMSDSVWPCGLRPTRLLCPRNSPGKSTGVGCHALPQGIFPTQGSNPGLLYCRFFTTEPPGKSIYIHTYIHMYIMNSFLILISKLGKILVVSIIGQSLPEACFGRAPVGLGRKDITITPFHWALSKFVRVPKATILPINSATVQKVNQHFQQEDCVLASIIHF